MKGTGPWPACHEIEPSAAEDPSCRGVDASLRWCDVEAGRGGARAQVRPRHLTIVQNCLGCNGGLVSFSIQPKKILIRIILTVECYFRLHSTKNHKLWTICQLATCEDLRQRTGLGLPSYTITTYSAKSRQ
ncbi:hypothetical protein TNCV_2203721 [Trichonephila clavipes]|nr:hypothetical protein TNCV_2203721 [Trichonephila clavipes]